MSQSGEFELGAIPSQSCRGIQIWREPSVAPTQSPWSNTTALSDIRHLLATATWSCAHARTRAKLLETLKLIF